jgi:16S rRNA processing protein RimM
MVFQHALGGSTDLKGVTVLFVEMQRGSLLPYFIETAKAKSATETLVKLEGIRSKEDASLLLQKQAWIEEKDFARLVKPNATIALLGFSVMDGKQVLGIIGEIIEQPHQVICSVMVGKKEVLVPLNDSTLVQIDRKLRKVYVNLPHGLLDIYLT